MYCSMEQWLDIRKRVLREGVSKRQILRETGMHWTTLKKILEHSSPPGYQRSKRPGKPKIDPYVDRIREILEQDKLIDRRQRHTAKKIWERLRQEGFTGGYAPSHPSLLLCYRQSVRSSLSYFSSCKNYNQTTTKRCDICESCDIYQSVSAAIRNSYKIARISPSFTKPVLYH